MNVQQYQQAMATVAETFHDSVEKAAATFREDVRNIHREFLGTPLDDDLRGVPDEPKRACG